ncbi:MAG: hypothetical protein IH788_06725 [Nitrospinae bacterium]|nr:hypothetical protein [Nitrospinota bacterium]
MEAYGVDTVFGIPGVHTLELYRGLGGAKIRHIQARHEQGAGFMADGYARVSGRAGVCYLITGPGVTNAATPIGQAYSDSIPMLVISSVNATADLGMGRGRLHEITDQSAVTAPLTAFSKTAPSAAEVPNLIAEAFAVFRNAHEFEALVFVEQTLQPRANQGALIRNHHRNRGSVQRRHLEGLAHRRDLLYHGISGTLPGRLSPRGKEPRPA